MTIAPGPWAPTVTQWVAGAPTRDAHNNEIPSFTPREVRALADYAAGGVASQVHEINTAAADIVRANRVLLLDPSITVSAEDEWTASDGNRYRADGEPSRYQSSLTGTAVTQVNLRRIY